MGFWSWWKRTTFEGKIKREVGEISSTAMKLGGTSIQVQELEKSFPTDNRRFRLNVVFKSLAAY